MFNLLGSHLDLSELIIMIVSCRLIYSLEVAINMFICFYKVPAGKNSLSSKVKIRGMLHRLIEYIFQNMLSTDFHLKKVCGGV